MESLSLQPSEMVEKNSVQEQVEAKSLNEATFAPEGYVERQGDYHQAEAIQSTLATVLESQPVTYSNEGAQDQIKPVSLNETPLPASINQPSIQQANLLEQAVPSGPSPLGMKYDGISEAVLPPSEVNLGVKLDGSQEQVLPPSVDGGGIKDVGIREQVLSPSEVNLGVKLDGLQEQVLPPAGIGENWKLDGVTEKDLPANELKGEAKFVSPTESGTPKTGAEIGAGLAGSTEAQLMTHLVDQADQFLGNLAQDLGQKANEYYDNWSLKLQSLMEKKSQFETTLSNIVKSFETTQEDLINNLK